MDRLSIALLGNLYRRLDKYKAKRRPAVQYRQGQTVLFKTKSKMTAARHRQAHYKAQLLIIPVHSTFTGYILQFDCVCNTSDTLLSLSSDTDVIDQRS